MKLLFVYNADAGAGNAFLDSLQKIIKPGDSNCSLCSLTHGVLGERSKWKRFRQSLPEDTVFMHRDEFKRTYRSKWLPKYKFPVILVLREGSMETFMSSGEIDALQNLNEFIDLIRERLDQY